MKKILFLLIATIMLTAPIMVIANEAGEVPIVDPIDALEIIIRWAFYVLMIVAVLFFIIAGFMFVTARGNDEQIKKARSMLTYAVIGLVVALLAAGAVEFIQRIFK